MIAQGTQEADRTGRMEGNTRRWQSRSTTRRASRISLVLTCVVLLATLAGGSIRPTQAATIAGPVPGSTAANPATPDAVIGTGFTYQGRLIQSNNPANGQFDLRFTLFDALTGGNQMGSPVSLVNQTVTDGLFTVSLDFGASAYQGDSRFLQIEVRQTGGGTYTLLSPRQPLTPAPYALSLRPGAVISGTLASPLFIVNNTGSNTGVYGASNSGDGGQFSSTTGYGVQASGGTGVYATGGNGVYSIGTASNGVGLWGVANTGSTAKGVYGTSSSGYGVYGNSTANNGTGVYGVANTGTTASGVYGTSATGAGGNFTSTTGAGVLASGSAGIIATSIISGAIGVWGMSTGGQSIAVLGQSSAGRGVEGDSSTNHGVYGSSAANHFAGVYGVDNGGTAASGVYGTSATGAGLDGVSNSGYGVFGTTSTGTGVYGISSSGTGVYGLGYGTGTGVHGENTSGVAVSGTSSTGTGIYGSSTGWAGYFSGNVNVTGTCCGSSEGYTRIDDPLDPQNKYLDQSLVQSPDMLSVINGNITTDGSGEATIQLPEYFEAANHDFRYQLTVIGQFAQAIVASEVKDNSFTIKTDSPDVKVSWQVTGVRNDPYAQDHPIQGEVNKPAGEQGKYLHPGDYGQPDSKGIVAGTGQNKP